MEGGGGRQRARVARERRDAAEAKMVDHFDTWITDSDFAWFASQGVNADAQGVLVLGTTPGSGFHRHLLEGWPDGDTLWDFLMLQVSYTGSGAWVTVRTRHGDTIDGVLSAPWSAVHGPYPPDSFPLDLGVVAKFLEIEVTLSSAVSGDTPLLEAINVIAYEQ